MIGTLVRMKDVFARCTSSGCTSELPPSQCLVMAADLPMTPSVRTGTVAMNRRLSVGTLHISFSPNTMVASFAPQQRPQSTPTPRLPCSYSALPLALYGLYATVLAWHVSSLSKRMPCAHPRRQLAGSSSPCFRPWGLALLGNTERCKVPEARVSLLKRTHTENIHLKRMAPNASVKLD